MTIRVIPTKRFPRWPWWALVAVGMWGAVTGGTAWLMQRVGSEMSVCMMKRMTGRPCLTCGSTRCVMDIARGDILGAVAWNPLVFLVLTLCAAAMVLRLVAARKVSVRLRPIERKAAWVVLLLMMGANWAYVILHGN